MTTSRNRRYRRRLPALLRRVLYPDAVRLADIHLRGAEVTEDIRFPSTRVDTPEAPYLGVWPLAKHAVGAHYDTPDYFSLRLSGVLYDPVCNLITTRSGAPIIDTISTFLPLTLRAWTRRINIKPRKIDGLCTVFRSVHGNYYHTLIEDMSRLFLLRQPIYRNMGTIKMLLPSEPTAFEQYLFDRYLPDNIQLEIVGRENYIEPDVLIAPSFLTQQSVTCLPRAFVDDLLSNLVPRRPRNKRRRIFISRKPGKNGAIRVVNNEEALWQALRSEGFERYALEDMSFDEEIDLFYDAEIVVAAHGAGLANLIFSDNIDVVELHASQIVVPYFYYMSVSLGHRYHWWKAEKKHFNASFSVDVPEVMAIVAKALGRCSVKTDESSSLLDALNA